MTQKHRAAIDAMNAAGERSPMEFFSSNVDRWGAAEWFNRLANAIREQDKAVVAGNDMSAQTYRNIAASSARRLVRDYEPQVRAALAQAAARSNSTGGSEDE